MPARTTAPGATPPPEADPTPAFDGHLLRIIAGGDWAADERTSAAHRRANRYRQFLDALGVAVYTTDADGMITFFNAAAATFWGRRPAIGEVWCGSLRLLWPDGSPMRHDECPMAVTLREARAVRGGRAIAIRPDDTQVSFIAYPTPLFDDAGHMIGAVNVLVDMTERDEAERALRESAEALEASNAVKDQFLGLVSHELRTPVTTIFGNARLLQARADNLTDEVRDAMIADIATDANRLHVIIENLLQLTRLGSGTRADLEPMLLDRIIERELESFRARNRGRVIELVGLRPDLDNQAIVEADETLLGLLLENLLGNAVKYSSPADAIEVAIDVVGDAVEVRILDRGIGFDEGVSERLFEPFYRSERARGAANGLGIGLALCRRIVDELGGRIWALPRDGGGAVVAFALPLAQDPG